MRFGVLGPLAVWSPNGNLVTIPGLKVRALLADLLVHDGRPASADRLIDDLWERDLPGNPSAALHAKVSQLRRALEEAEPGARRLVEFGPSGYRLRIPADAVDAGRFGRLVEQARVADPRGRVALLSEAVALWRGPTLADVADMEFARNSIVRLDEQRLVALEDLAEARLALGEHTLLVGELADLVAQHPLRNGCGPRSCGPSTDRAGRVRHSNATSSTAGSYGTSSVSTRAPSSLNSTRRSCDRIPTRGAALRRPCRPLVP